MNGGMRNRSGIPFEKWDARKKKKIEMKTIFRAKFTHNRTVMCVVCAEEFSS